MGKQSRRVRVPSAPRAPRTLPESTHPFFNSEFVPITLSADLLQLDIVETFQELVRKGTLADWQLGRKGTHISSFWKAPDGSTDYLTSPDPNDDNYEMLAIAHIQSVFSHFGLA